jgi:hypothetical protein
MKQLPLPAIRDWREPQTVSCREIETVIGQAQQDGFVAAILEPIVKPPIGYKVIFVKREPSIFGADGNENRHSGENSTLKKFEKTTKF